MLRFPGCERGSGLDVGEALTRLEPTQPNDARGREIRIHAELVTLQLAVFQGDLTDLKSDLARFESRYQGAIVEGFFGSLAPSIRKSTPFA